MISVFFVLELKLASLGINSIVGFINEFRISFAWNNFNTLLIEFADRILIIFGIVEKYDDENLKGANWTINSFSKLENMNEYFLSNYDYNVENTRNNKLNSQTASSNETKYFQISKTTY